MGLQLVSENLNVSALPVPAKQERATEVRPCPQLPSGSVGIKMHHWWHWQWVQVGQIRVTARTWMVQWYRSGWGLGLTIRWWIVHDRKRFGSLI